MISRKIIISWITRSISQLFDLSVQYCMIYLTIIVN